LLNQLSNLIYKVINLAGLSLLTVTAWSYSVDLTFLFIVYILAFVGAVVMLFLSVVLMLPTSVISKDTKLITPVTFGVVNGEFFAHIPEFLLVFVLIFFTLYTFSLLFPENFKSSFVQGRIKSQFDKLRRFQREFQGVSEFFALHWPIPVIRAITKNDKRAINLLPRYYPVLY